MGNYDSVRLKAIFTTLHLIFIILQCNTEHKNVFLHIPDLKITQIKIPRNIVDVFGTLTTWRHMKTFSYIWSKLKRTRNQMMSDLYVLNWKSSYDVMLLMYQRRQQYLNNIIEINRVLHKSLLKIWDFFMGVRKDVEFLTRVEEIPDLQ
jgi:hypothetical protein